MGTKKMVIVRHGSGTREASGMRSVSGDEELPRRGQTSWRGRVTFTVRGPGGQKFGVKTPVVMVVCRPEEQGIGGPGGWETGRGLGRGPVSRPCARGLELGTLEPSGLNPRAQTLGLEPRDRTRARVGGGHGTRRT